MKLQSFNEIQNKYGQYFIDILTVFSFINKPLTITELALLSGETYPNSVITDILYDIKSFLEIDRCNEEMLYMLNNKLSVENLQDEMISNFLVLGKNWIEIFNRTIKVNQRTKVYDANTIAVYEGSLCQKIFDAMFVCSETHAHKKGEEIESFTYDVFQFLFTHTVNMVQTFAYFYKEDKLQSEIWFGRELIESMFRNPAIYDKDRIRLEWVDVLNKLQLRNKGL